MGFSCPWYLWRRSLHYIGISVLHNMTEKFNLQLLHPLSINRVVGVVWLISRRSRSLDFVKQQSEVCVILMKSVRIPVNAVKVQQGTKD